jgi:hypothetical protein
VIPIPLRGPDPDCLCDLAVVFRTAYEEGYYEDNLDYDKPLEKSLPPAVQRWAMKLVKSGKK